jgi:hypothetical protein
MFEQAHVTPCCSLYPSTLGHIPSDLTCLSSVRPTTGHPAAVPSLPGGERLHASALGFLGCLCHGGWADGLGVRISAWPSLAAVGPNRVGLPHSSPASGHGAPPPRTRLGRLSVHSRKRAAGLLPGSAVRGGHQVQLGGNRWAAHMRRLFFSWGAGGAGPAAVGPNVAGPRRAGRSRAGRRRALRVLAWPGRAGAGVCGGLRLDSLKGWPHRLGRAVCSTCGTRPLMHKPAGCCRALRALMRARFLHLRGSTGPVSPCCTRAGARRLLGPAPCARLRWLARSAQVVLRAGDFDRDGSGSSGQICSRRGATGMRKASRRHGHGGLGEARQGHAKPQRLSQMFPSRRAGRTVRARPRRSLADAHGPTMNATQAIAAEAQGAVATMRTRQGHF